MQTPSLARQLGRLALVADAERIDGCGEVACVWQLEMQHGRSTGCLDDRRRAIRSEPRTHQGKEFLILCGQRGSDASGNGAERPIGGHVRDHAQLQLHRDTDALAVHQVKSEDRRRRYYGSGRHRRTRRKHLRFQEADACLCRTTRGAALLTAHTGTVGWRRDRRCCQGRSIDGRCSRMRHTRLVVTEDAARGGHVKTHIGRP